MCGICGFLSINSNADASTLHSMANLLRHRGPDDEGYIAVSTGEGTVTPLGGADSQVALPPLVSFGGAADLFLAHRRLSIIDLSPAGHQPMSYDGGNLWITFNGEIYNYVALREELVSQGHRFRTNTDTEVVLAAYREWGEACLDRFDGMWAFMLYDHRARMLWGARDRFGVKPIYYVRKPGLFAFASEMKALLPVPGISRRARRTAVCDYLAYGADHWNDGATFFEDIYELPAAHKFKFFVESDSLEISRYYSLPVVDIFESFKPYRFQDHVEHVRELSLHAVRSHLMSDVPVGSCLSGGVDSSSIVGTISRILRTESLEQVGNRQQTFTACYEDSRIDESVYAEKMARHAGAQWHRVFPQGDELVADLDDLVRTQDVPFGSTSIYAQYCVMKLAKEHGVTVLLDGQGGDELFTGYSPYYVMFFRELVKRGAWGDFAREWQALGNASISKGFLVKRLGLSWIRRHMPDMLLPWSALRARPELEYIAPDLWQEAGGRERLQGMGKRLMYSSLQEMLGDLMCHSSLPALLRYEDRNAMRFQIESRTPFADSRALIEKVFSIPSIYKIHNGWSKALLREAAKADIPDEIYRRRDKIGFATPEFDWLSPHQESMRGWFTSDLAAFVDVEKILTDWPRIWSRQPRTGITGFWRFLNVALWQKCFAVC